MFDKPGIKTVYTEYHFLIINKKNIKWKNLAYNEIKLWKLKNVS